MVALYVVIFYDPSMYHINGVFRVVGILFNKC